VSLLRVRGCQDCLDKQRQIDDLTAKLTAARQTISTLRRAQRGAPRRPTEAPFGASTPSAKLPLKAGATAENQAKRGGAQAGHPGHGRRPFAQDAAPFTAITLPPAACCRACGGALEDCQTRTRDVLDARPLTVERKVYTYTRQRCRGCGHWQQPQVPGVLPKARLSNRLLTTLAIEHFLHGVPLAALARRLGLSVGTCCQALQQLAGRFGTIFPRLLAAFRQAPRKHADETSWRCDGANGYGWYFGNLDTSLFCYRRTRAGSVVTEILGTERLPGALVVDRYGGYNRAPCARQYCYAHLLRDLQDLETKHPASREVAAFVTTLAPLLAAVMHLHPSTVDDQTYYQQAAALKAQIQAAIARPARQGAIQKYQTIFRRLHADLYHWAADRRIPPDNNFAERALRPTVIARKTSFGSQSPQGAHTRELAMTALHTLAKRHPNPADRLCQALDTLIVQPTANLVDLLFPVPTNTA